MIEDPKPEDTGPPSINEPPGSKVKPDAPAEAPPAGETPPPGGGAPPAPAKEPLLSDAELSAMTRVELDEYAEGRGVDSTDCATKADVVALLKSS